jgi:hypothetical protein
LKIINIENKEKELNEGSELIENENDVHLDNIKIDNLSHDSLLNV